MSLLQVCWMSALSRMQLFAVLQIHAAAIVPDCCLLTDLEASAVQTLVWCPGHCRITWKVWLMWIYPKPWKAPAYGAGYSLGCGSTWMCMALSKQPV